MKKIFCEKLIFSPVFDVDFKLNDYSIIIKNIFFQEENSNKVKNFDVVDQIILNNKQNGYDYFNPILFRKFIKEIIVAYSHVG